MNSTLFQPYPRWPSTTLSLTFSSKHDADQVRASVDKHEHGSTSLFRTLSNKLRRNSEQNLADRPANQERRPTFELDDVERQERIMSKPPQGLYERFRRGLLEYHSEVSREKRGLDWKK